MDQQYMVPQQPAQAAPGTSLSKRQAKQQLGAIVGGAHEVLIQANTVFPFTLFPDTITVDRQKVTVTHRVFFGIAEVVSLRIEDILSINADVGPFFGSIKITTRFFDNKEPPYVVNFLWRSDALRLKRIVQGYVIATQQHIDCSAFGTEELAAMLDKLGQGAPHEEI